MVDYYLILKKMIVFLFEINGVVCWSVYSWVWNVIVNQLKVYELLLLFFEIMVEQLCFEEVIRKVEVEVVCESLGLGFIGVVQSVLLVVFFVVVIFDLVVGG